MLNMFQEAPKTKIPLKILLSGAAGTGKTVAALSFPRVAYIDTEGGTRLYRAFPEFAHVRWLDTKSLSDVEKAIAAIATDGGKSFDTLVLDSVSALYDVLKEATSKLNRTGDMGFREWSKVNGRMKALYNSLTNLQTHVIVISRESTEYETSGSELRKIGVKPDADKNIAYLFDFHIRMKQNHQGEVLKSRGVMLGNNGVLPAVNWSVFEPIADVFSEGQQRHELSDEESAEMERAAMLAKEFSDRAIVTEFVQEWRKQGMNDSDLLKALNVAKFSEWAGGAQAANSAVRTWLDGQLKR